MPCKGVGSRFSSPVYAHGRRWVGSRMTTTRDATTPLRLGPEPGFALRFITGCLAVVVLFVGIAGCQLVAREAGYVGLIGAFIFAAGHIAARGGHARVAAVFLRVGLIGLPVVLAVGAGSFWLLPLALLPAYPAIMALALGQRSARLCLAVTSTLLVGGAFAFPEPLALGEFQLPVPVGLVGSLAWMGLATVGIARVVETRDALSESARVLASVPDFVAILDTSTRRVVWANAAAHASLGYPVLQGMDVRVFSRPDATDPDELEAQIADGCVRGVHVRSDGTEFRVEVHLTRMRRNGRDLTVACARDVSQTEARLYDGERHALTAQLSTGLVHDFNNLLAVIHYAGMELDQLVGAEARPAVEDLTAATERARGLARSMQAFSRGAERAAEQTVIHERVRRTAELVRRVLPNSVRLEVDIRCQDPVRVGLTELDQILVNLVVNARDAMPDGGNITVRLERATSGIALRVIDDGAGMDAETLAQAATPFFTTRGDAGGSGLGLAMVSSMASAADAQVVLESTVGEGTSVSVVFPDPVHVRTAPVVLIVDDEQLIRRAYRRTLRREGLQTLETGTAAEAAEILRSDVGIDLVLSDWVMPGHNGGWLAQQAAMARPGLPILLISGVQIAGQPGDVLRKPLTSEQLLDAVRRKLEQTAQDPAAASSSVA